MLSLPVIGKMETAEPDAESALFNNLPRVALLVKEEHVEPERINPDAMLASILEVLELNISKLVVTLPKTLSDALEKSKKGDELAAVVVQDKKPEVAPLQSNAPEVVKPEVIKKEEKEQLTLDLGGVKKVIDYEPQRSLWGLIFKVREVFKFVETEAKKQKLAEKFKDGEEPIDWQKIEYAAINAMLSPLDSHSAFLEPKYARDLTLTTKGEFGGVGIVISVRDGFLTVISPIEGTPAAKEGVKAKDRIVKIDEDSAINMPLEDAVSKLRGAPDSKVKITVQRAAPSGPKEYDFVLKRSNIKVDSVSHALLDNNVGYVRIKAFQGNTAADVQAAILDMKQKSKNKMPGIILDMRDNPGGLLREAIAISDLFLSGGEIVSTQGSQKKSRQVEMATPGELDEKLKIAVLVNGGSASASEIVSAAIKYGGPHVDDPEEGRGIVIGDSATFGKGSVQMLFDFPDLRTPEAKDGQQQPVQPAALKLTIAQYYAPQGRIIQTVGVKPDILITPVRADKANELSLFQSTSRREIDLESHLAAAKNREEKSVAQINFLAPRQDDEANEYTKLSKNKIKSDFAVKVASDFIVAAKGNTRKDLLAVTNQVKDKLDKLEHKKISDALKKYHIDWSSGKALKDNQALKTILVANNTVVAGDKLKVTLKVKNTSKEPAYQVHGITHSKTDIFDQREFIFGKIKPGQEVERTLIFDIPQDVVTRKDLMKVEIKDVAQEKISELNIALGIKGLERPRFSHMVYVDEEKSNNEEVELVVWIKNIGNGKAFEPTVLLRNDSGSKIFLKTGREKIGELMPNQESSMRFSFRVKEPTDKAEFELQIFDGKMHDVWRDKIAIPVNNNKAPKKIQAVNQQKIVNVDTTSVLAQPDKNAQILATLRSGFIGAAIEEVSDYYLIKVAPNLVGFVKKSDLKDTSVKNLPKEKLYSINYERIPAQVSLKFADNQGWTNDISGQLSAEIANAQKVSEVLLYVNGKKVLYQAIEKPEATQKIAQQITLKPGMNVISLFAREDSRYGQRESITVFYDDQKLGLSTPEPVTNTKIKAQH
jgi:carboxyl-terminal processing protease